MKTKNSLIPGTKTELPTNPIFDAYNDLIIDLTAEFNSHHDIKVVFDNGLFTYPLTSGQKKFFKKLYVVAKNDSIVLFPRHIKELYPEITKLRIGKNEWQLIDFVTSQNYDMTRIVSIITPIGRGKSTLLSYTFLFLREEIPNLKKRVIPIAINCHGLKAPLNDKVNKDATFDFFLKAILFPNLSKIIHQYVNVDDVNFWDWYSLNYHTTFGIRYKSLNDAIKRVTSEHQKDNFRSQLLQLKIDELEKEDFLYSAIEYIKETHDKEIVFIFDNMDFLSIKHIQYIIEFVERLKDKTSLKFILTLREITSKKVSEKFRGTLLDTMLDWVPIDSIEVIRRRCDILDESLLEEAEKNPIIIGNKKIFVSNVQELITGLTRAIRNSIGLIEMFSSNNMRNELILLRIILKSGLLPEWSLNTVLFQFANEYHEIKKIPKYIILEAIITNNYGTYIDAKKRSVPGLINIFSANKSQYILDFMFLIILSDLIKHNENDVLIKDICNRLYQLFLCCGKEIFEEAFYDIITSLINSGLIVSSEVYEVSASDDVRLDVRYIKISKLGLFYMNNLIFNYNYLIFVKDNINIFNIHFLGTMETRNQSYHKNSFNRKKYTRLNLIALTAFLDEFGKKELELFKYLQSNQNLLPYFDFYSNVNKSMYTIKIIESILEYFDNDKYDNPDVLDRLKKLKNQTISNFNELLRN